MKNDLTSETFKNQACKLLGVLFVASSLLLLSCKKDSIVNTILDEGKFKGTFQIFELDEETPSLERPIEISFEKGNFTAVLTGANEQVVGSGNYKNLQTKLVFYNLLVDATIGNVHFKLDGEYELNIESRSKAKFHKTREGEKFVYQISK